MRQMSAIGKHSAEANKSKQGRTEDGHFGYSGTTDDLTAGNGTEA